MPQNDFNVKYKNIKLNLEQLQKTLQNLKKSISRNFSSDYIKEKHRISNIYIKNIFKSIAYIEDKFNLNETTYIKLDTKRQLAKILIKEIKAILKKKEHPFETDEKDDDIFLNEIRNLWVLKIMANFSFEIGMKMPELAKPGTEETRDFLNTIETYYDVLNEAGKTSFIKFICKAKIKGLAKTKLGQFNQPDNFEELKAEIIKKCLGIESIEALTNKLSNAKQQKKTEEEFAAEVSEIAQKLTTLEIGKTQNITAEAKKAVENVYKGQALSAFQKGLNDAIKTAVIASRPANIEQALEVATTAKATAEIETKFVGNIRDNTKFLKKNSNHSYFQKQPNKFHNQQNSNYNNNTNNSQRQPQKQQQGRHYNDSRNYRQNNFRNWNNNSENRRNFQPNAKMFLGQSVSQQGQLNMGQLYQQPYQQQNHVNPIHPNQQQQAPQQFQIPNPSQNMGFPQTQTQTETFPLGYHQQKLTF
jgi:hypothetical protein